MQDLLSDFRRIHLCHQPTPLEEMPRLTAALGGPRLWIKRDDCTGLATGGNKTRKLEFLMAEAQDAGADMVVTQGAVQSNHVRQTAAAARKNQSNASPARQGTRTVSYTHLTLPTKA